MRRDLDRIISAIAERRLSLELGPIDICFLVALSVKADAAGLSEFTEQQLEDVFELASAAVQPEAQHVRRRATAAIHRLREQRLLSRVDGQGVVRTGEFALSRLGSAIVEFFLEEDVLTRASLGLLTSSLRTALADVLATAKGLAHEDRDGWRDRIAGPLQVSIAELIAGIERRQRGLDAQQEDFQAEIRRLLEVDWFGALDRCQELLESTSATLHELDEVLLRDASVLLALLHDIEELAAEAAATEAETAAHRLMDQIDRSVAWSAARQRAWSEYFQYVHRYLRDVVRLDPSRALTQRLRAQLAGDANAPKFALAYASAAPLRILRTVTAPPDPKPVVRPRAPREKEPATETPDDPQAALTARVTEVVARGAKTLSAVTSEVTANLETAGERFVEAGRVAATVAQVARVASAVERAWVPVGELEMEEWDVEARS